MSTELETFPFDYEKDYGEQLACAYHNKQYISEAVCCRIRHDCDGILDCGEGRWVEHVTVIFEYKGKYYGLDFDEGLTECQENEYWKQVPKMYKKIQVIRYTYEEVKEEKTDGKTTDCVG